MADLVPYVGKKKKTSGSGVKCAEEIETGDMTAILTLAIESSSSRMGRPAIYPHTSQGLETFIQNSIDYFEYVNTVNSDPKLKRKLIPDIENWAVYLGVTRQTIWGYEKRGGEWKDAIDYYKNIIAAVKKQLVLNFKIPPVVHMFDFTNNHGYVNSSEFKLAAGDTEKPQKENIDTQIQELGLVWNEEKGAFEAVEE